MNCILVQYKHIQRVTCGVWNRKIINERKSYAERNKRNHFHPFKIDSLQHYGVSPTVPITLICDFWLMTIHSTNLKRTKSINCQRLDVPENWESSAHFTHSLAPFSEQVFLGHTWQLNEPGLLLKVPGLHGKHSDVYATPV